MWFALVFATTIVIAHILSWFWVFNMTEREKREWFDVNFFYLWLAIVICFVVMYIVFKLDPGGAILDDPAYG